MAKADNYSFLKKLVENVKETKDVQAPDDEEANKVKKVPRYNHSELTVLIYRKLPTALLVELY